MPEWKKEQRRGARCATTAGYERIPKKGEDQEGAILREQHRSPTKLDYYFFWQRRACP